MEGCSSENAIVCIMMSSLVFYLQLPFSYLCANWPLQVSTYVKKIFLVNCSVCVCVCVCVRTCMHAIFI